MDKISVVIPVYNTKIEYLEKCLESVLTQNHEELEVIIIDDGSEIETANLCDEYAEKDKRIKVIHKQNEGVSVARNVGIEEAKGKWIFFLDSDDWLEKDSFEGIERYNTNDVVMFKYNIYEKGQSKLINSWYENGYIIDKPEEIKGLVKQILINNDNSSTLGMSTSKLYNLDFLKTHDIKFPVGVPFREDSVFSILVFQRCSKILLSTKVIYNYRINDTSVTQKKDIKCIENSEKLIKACKRILEDEYLPEYYAFVIWQLNYICIKSIFVNDENNKLRKLKEVLKNPEYAEAVKNVDLRILSKRKQILVLLLRMKLYFLLKYLYSCNTIKGGKSMKNEIKKKLKNVAKLILYPFISLAYLCVRKRKFNVIDDKATIDKIVNEGYSISRFGDGEFLWILGKNKKSFQDNSEELSRDLKEILDDYKSDGKILVGIYGTMNDLSKHTYRSKVFWKYFMLKYRKPIYDILPEAEYCDTALTRPYMDYKDKSTELMQSKFDNLKRIWNDRDVIIVEGEYTRLGVGNDLFDNCKSIRRIICPPKNAYFKYDEIVNEIRNNASKTDLILMSLGPAATILSYNMAKEGYQCIDTGHIDIEYMWFKNGAKVKEAVTGKYVNEVKKEKPEDIENENYFNQIVAKISL